MMLTIGNKTEVDNDFFEEYFSSKELSVARIGIFVLGIVIGIFGPIGLIWYERNCKNRFRTVINQLVATDAWFILLWCLFVYIPDGARFSYGPFGELFCDIEIFLKNVLWSCMLITLDVILMLRYAFIFYVKNFAVINDDVLALILNLSIVIVSIWLSVVKRFTPGNLPLSYYLCSGLNPNQNLTKGSYLSTPKKYNTGRLVLVISFVLHLVMIPRIAYYQFITNKKEQTIQLGTINSRDRLDVLNNQVCPSGRIPIPTVLNKNKHIIDMVTYTAVLVTLCIVGILIGMSDSVEPKHFNLEKNHWIPLSMQLYGPAIGGIAILTVLMAMTTTDRKGIWRQIPAPCKRY